MHVSHSGAGPCLTTEPHLIGTDPRRHVNEYDQRPCECARFTLAEPGLRPVELSPLARAYGQIWDVLRADTEQVLTDLFRCDPSLVEEAGIEWFEAHPDWIDRIDNPPEHPERRSS